MRRADQVAGALLFLFALGFAAVGRTYTYWGSAGPGPGFLPVWLGAALAVLAVLLAAGATRRRDAGAPWLPAGVNLRRLVAVAAGTAVLTTLVQPLGMTVAIALFLLAILRGLERLAWPLALGVSLATAAASDLVFARLLGVPFPPGVLRWVGLE